MSTINALSEVSSDRGLFSAKLKDEIKSKKIGDRITTAWTAKQGSSLCHQSWFQDALLSTPNEVGIVVPREGDAIQLIIGSEEGVNMREGDLSIGHTHNINMHMTGGFAASIADFTSNSRTLPEGEYIISPQGLYNYKLPPKGGDLNLLTQAIGFRNNGQQDDVWSVNGLARQGAYLDFETYKRFLEYFFNIQVDFKPKPAFAREMSIQKVLHGGGDAFFYPFKKYIPELSGIKKKPIGDKFEILRSGISEQLQPRRYDNVTVRE